MSTTSAFRSPSVRSTFSSTASICAVAALALTIFGCAKTEDTKESHLANGDKYFAADQYDKAAQEYRDVLRLDPSDLTASRQLAIIYQSQGQFAQAMPFVKKVLELKPDDLDFQLKLGRELLASGKFAPARDEALKVLQKRPGDDEALVVLTTASVALNAVDAARTSIRDLQKNDQDRPAYHVALGLLSLRANELETAEREFKIALQLDSKSARAYAGLGAVYLVKKQVEQARAAFKSAAELSDQRSPLKIQYVDFLVRNNDIAQAKAILDEITTKIPDYLPARIYLMKLACTDRRNAPQTSPKQEKTDQTAHEDDDCAARVKNILAQDPSNFDALFQDGLDSLARGDALKAGRTFEFLSNSYSKNAQVEFQLARANLLYAQGASPDNAQKALTRAETSLTNAVQLDPRFAPAILMLAEVKIKKGSPASATSMLERLVDEQPNVPQPYYLLASAYLGLQQMDKAVGMFQRITTVFPKDPQGFYLLGSALASQGRKADAIRALERSVAVNPTYLPAVERLVDIDLADKHFTEALDRVQTILTKEPTQAQALALRGKVHLAQRDFNNAEADLSKAIQFDPKLEPAYNLLTRLYIATNRQQDAIERLKSFVDKDKSLPSLMQLALLYEQTNRDADARAAYESALKVNPNFAPALNNLAIIYQKSGDVTKAIELSKRATEIAPNEPHMADTRGWALYKSGDYAGALQWIREAATKLPDEREIQFHLGMTQYMLGDESGAHAALERTTTLPGNTPATEEVQEKLSLLDMPSESGPQALQSYLEKNPTDPVALFRQAQAQEHEGSVERAIATYEKLLKGDPLYAPATLRVVALYAQNPKDVQKAYELATRARQDYPDDARTSDLLGWVLVKRGEYDRALPLLQEAATKLPNSPESQYHLGVAYYMVGNEPLAREALGRAVDAKAEFTGKSDARQRLGVLKLEVRPGDAVVRTKLATYLSENPKDPAALFRLAQFQEADGAFEKAMKTYTELLDQNAAFSPATRQIALLYGEHSIGDPRAYDFVTRARQAYPDDPRLSKFLGIINYRRSLYPQAAEQLKSASARRDSDADLFYYLGQTYRQLKQRSECSDALNRALKLNLSPDLVEQAKQALQECSGPSRP